MSLIDSILNLAALLLWINWRSLSLSKTSRPAVISLLATLKESGPVRPKRWLHLLGLVCLLGLRSIFYWHIGSSVNWTPQLCLGVLVLPFRSDYLGRMTLFSLLSFGQVLAGFYLWLFLLSAVNRNIAERDPFQQWIRLQLGWFDRWPAFLKLLLPWLAGGLLWLALNPAFVRLGLLPPAQSWSHLGQQAVVIGAAAFLAWKIILLALLLLHLLNAFVFLGDFAWWRFVNASARNLLRPIAWLPLRIGRVDFTPVLGIALVLLATELGLPNLSRLYQRLPLQF